MFECFAGAKMHPAVHAGVGENHPTAGTLIRRCVGTIAVCCVLALQPACLFRKHNTAKAPQAPAPAVRIAVLPFNVPADNANLRWVGMAAPLVMAKTIERAATFDVVPVWQSYPVALESLGAARSITPEIAAYVAERVGAKWATNGELAPTKDGVWMRVDFIPAKPNLVPYRFEKTVRLDAMGSNAYAAFSQFSDYLVLRPLPKPEGKGVSATSMKELAEALDREYGWYVPADPGKSEKLVAGLAKTDMQLARILFDPILYPAVGSVAAKAKPVELRPTAPPAAEKQVPGDAAPPAQPIPPPAKPVSSETPPAAAENPTPAPPVQTQTAKPATSEEKPPAQPAVTAPAPVEAVPSAASPAPAKAQAAAQPGPPQKPAPSRKRSSANPPPLKSGIPASVTQPESTTPAETGAAGGTEAKKTAPAATVGPYQIQVYSTQSRQAADSKAAVLVKAGYLPKVDEVDLKEKGIWFRIRLQGFKSREEAKAAGEKLLADKLIRQYWIVR